jgi:hypothetical protein
MVVCHKNETNIPRVLQAPTCWEPLQQITYKRCVCWNFQYSLANAPTALHCWIVHELKPPITANNSPLCTYLTSGQPRELHSMKTLVSPCLCLHHTAFGPRYNSLSPAVANHFKVRNFKYTTLKSYHFNYQPANLSNLRFHATVTVT